MIRFKQDHHSSKCTACLSRFDRDESSLGDRAAFCRVGLPLPPPTPAFSSSPYPSSSNSNSTPSPTAGSGCSPPLPVLGFCLTQPPPPLCSCPVPLFFSPKMSYRKMMQEKTKAHLSDVVNASSGGIRLSAAEGGPSPSASSSKLVKLSVEGPCHQKSRRNQSRFARFVERSFRGGIGGGDQVSPARTR